MKEVWRDIPGYTLKYLVSSYGRVFSLYSWKYLKPGRMSSGHLSVCLGRGNSRCVHELVLTTFKGPRPEGADSRHLNGMPDDNRLDNLEWAGRAINTIDKKYHGQQGQNRYTLSEIQQVKDMIALGNTGVCISKVTGMSEQGVSAIRRGVYHTDV